jgi:L-aspartate oxidase
MLPLPTKILWMRQLEFDTIVIGSGLAGLTAAYYSSRYGRVAIVTKSELDTSNSWFAQGGIAAVSSPDDSPEFHLQDTLEAGRGLCDYPAVEILVTEGRDRVKELIDMGMPFDRDQNGEILLGLEGGHHKRRILHAGGDATGKELTRFMLKKVIEIREIVPFEFTAAVRLLQCNGVVCGVQGLNFYTGENVLIKAKSVILATGGLSRVYNRSTNPHTATGDGVALAYQSGARVADLEFVQFHPTALCLPGKEAFLISEAVRGEGAWLLNGKGERFMKEVHPMAELAPRDVVAYHIFMQMKKSGDDAVFLSLRHLDPVRTSGRFATIYQTLQEYGLDLTRDLIPVAPAAHYMVGGIRSGLHGETNLKGLFVCGEAASTGVMGANRLASNSLLECLVFGKRASEKAAEQEKIHDMPDDVQGMGISPGHEQRFLELKNQMAELMSQHLGIIRNRPDMEMVLSRFSEIYEEAKNPHSDYNILKIKNIAEICILISRAAILREESRGGHIRSDFPEEDPRFRIHILQEKGKEPCFEPVQVKS